VLKSMPMSLTLPASVTSTAIGVGALPAARHGLRQHSRAVSGRRGHRARRLTLHDYAVVYG
jgi:hypothetical protein